MIRDKITSIEMAKQEIKRFGHIYNELNEKCDRCHLKLKIAPFKSVDRFYILTKLLYNNINREYIIAYIGIERPEFLCSRLKVLL